MASAFVPSDAIAANALADRQCSRNVPAIFLIRFGKRGVTIWPSQSVWRCACLTTA